MHNNRIQIYISNQLYGTCDRMKKKKPSNLFIYELHNILIRVKFFATHPYLVVGI